MLIVRRTFRTVPKLFRPASLPFSLFSISLAATLSSFFAPPLLAAPPIPEGYVQGTPWNGPVGIRESTADIMQREAQQAQKKKPYRVRLRRTIELPEHIDSLKDSQPAQPTGPSPI